jgi:methylmalonyl-CoA/ethylmalonyl-CoA epimerase
MPLPNSIAGLGEIMQIAFLPKDFDAAVAYWTKTMGVGPFFLLENISIGEMRCMGERSDAVFSVAIAYWNDIQIELIRPENDSPAHYTGRYAVTDGPHHVCVVVDDIAQVRTTLEQAGATLVVEGTVGDDGHVIYADPGYGPGGMIEFYQPFTGGRQLFEVMKDAARTWDGSDPLRTLGF